MNKKIKVIDLMQKCANKENIPERILYKNTAFVLNDCKCYYNEEKDERLLDYIIPTFSNLNEEVEILEDNTEEQEKLGESWKELGKRVGEWAKEFEQGFKESFTEIINYPFKNLEDNTEEIEELKPNDCYFRDGTELVYRKMYDKINELVKKVNQLTVKLANTVK